MRPYLEIQQIKQNNFYMRIFSLQLHMYVENPYNSILIKPDKNAFFSTDECPR